MRTPPTLAVFSHLRWDFVFQRPQHLMTRLAATRPVLFIEEPVHDAGEPHWEVRQVAPNLTVARPHTPVAEPGFAAAQVPVLGPMVQMLLDGRAGGGYDLWFYTPLALPLSAGLSPGVVVYDCMDELSAFKFAPPALLEREAELLARADVVFTGGPSLYRAKKDRHPNCHCFASSVDAAHFAKALGTDRRDPPAQTDIPRPRLGYFGVIDERFDLPLLAAAAAARPAWHFVLVGPVAKIDPADLPTAPNIHYIGQQQYADLPAFLGGWDVALLPFARNDSTKFISPTKTLEYMAADKPIVSTSITDVAEPYGEMVGLADTPEAFVAACERALGETEAERARRQEQFRSVLARTSWDTTAAAMAAEIDRVRGAEPDARSEGDAGGAAHSVANRLRKLPGGADPGESPLRVPAHPAAYAAGSPLQANQAAPIVVIGAGPTGLSAAHHLGEDTLLLEANDRVGGWCRSVLENGFTFDFAGHIMFSNDPYVHELYAKLLGDNVHWQDREAWIYSQDGYTRYPFQGALYGLPNDVIKECLLGAIEARYGKAEAPAAPPKPSANGHGHANGNGNGHANGTPLAKILAAVKGETNGHANGNGNGTCHTRKALNDKGDEIVDCCGDGVAESTVPLVEANGRMAAGQPTGPRNFEEFIYQVWGAGIAKHFAIPYNQKIWAVPLTEMETSWLGGRVPMPDLGEMIDGALSPKGKPMGPNARFGYPLKGGFQALMDGFLPHLRGELRLNARVKAVSPLRRVVTLMDGTEVPYDQLVSTMPLPALIRAMADEAPPDVRAAAARLRHTSVRCVNLGIGRERLTDKHWIYYPGDTVFHRIFVQGNASPQCNPPGGFGLTCEITYGPAKPLPCDGPALIRRCIDDCVKVGIIRADDAVLSANQVDMPCAYVVYDHARPANIALVRAWLDGHDIHLAGRYSEWEYYNSDHAFLAGKRVAEAARARQADAVAI